MAAPELRICPSCGTRNKKGWEYGVRGGEDLGAGALGGPATAEAAAEPDSTGDGSTWLSLVGPVVAIGLAIYAGNRIYHAEGSTKPSPALFDIPTLPPSTPAARPDVAGSGES